ncbi:GL21160 [Drosophila persimilis]|uniref:GL21160 n=1 Tax=Drosophila persimilis TaxID=7234 RepID=B4GX96_DROPE|nr:GL21160 [Drosophila persimilis]
MSTAESHDLEADPQVEIDNLSVIQTNLIARVNQTVYVSSEVAFRFDEDYTTAFSIISEAYENVCPRAPPVQQNPEPANPSVSSVQLPKLPVPTFTGKFVDWPAFHDAFVQLIHNNQKLSDVQRFHFLKQALPSDRDEDIQQMALAGNNYATAWSLVLKRYDNKRLQFMYHMNGLYDLPQLTKEQSADIKHMLNVATVCLNAFKNLDVQHWMAHHLTSRLPSPTLQAWELHLGSSAELATFSQLQSFLNDRLVSIDVFENRGHSTTRTPVPQPVNQRHPKKSVGNVTYKGNSFHAKAAVAEHTRCPHCSDSHNLRHCPDLLSKDCFARKAIVDHAKACLNCLSRSHALSKCTSKRNCTQCGQRHHTLLHFPTPAQVATQPHAASHSARSGHSWQYTTSDSSGRATPTQLYARTPLPTQSTAQPLPVVPNTSSGGHPQSAATDSSVRTHSAQLVSATATHHGPSTVLLATALVTIHNPHTGQSAVIGQNTSICTHAKVCILFSGGIDCTVLAILADRYVPDGEPIELINVAFERITAPNTADTQEYWNVPDRKTALQSYNELKRICPKRFWILIEVNVTRQELQLQLSQHIRHLIYPLQTVLDESLGCAFWFATHTVLSSARVALIGSGADELFGGYTRHRNAYRHCLGDDIERQLVVQNELEKDWQRIPARNLARDDRVIADNGKTARAPFIEENVVRFVRSLMPKQKCCYSFPEGVGDKLLLRLYGYQLGLRDAVLLKKRAIQFGSRIADKKQHAAQHSIFLKFNLANSLENTC